MLAYMQTVLHQILIMTLLMALGWILFRAKLIDETGSRQISALLMKIVTPAVILMSFQRPFERAFAVQLAVSAALTLFAYAVPIAIAALVFRRDALRAEKTLCLTFSNNGFMAIPLLQALLGPTGVALGSAHIVAGNVLLWTFGARTVNGKAYRLNAKTLLLNPGAIALFLGLALFISPVKLPALLYETGQYIAGLNTPLAMVLLGVYMAQSDLARCVRDAGLQVLAFLKLAGIPLVLVGVFCLLPVEAGTAMAVLVGSAAPCGMFSPMLMQYFGRETGWCTRAVAYTSLWSILTMPLVLTLADALL